MAAITVIAVGSFGFLALFAIWFLIKIGLGFAAIGPAIILILVAAGVLARLNAARNAPPARKCPDCAETIQPDAKVCRHCGYRFVGS